MSSSNNSPNTAPPTSSPPLSSPMAPSKKRVTQTYGSKRAEAQLPDESSDADRSFGTLIGGDISTLLSPAAHSREIDDNIVSSQDTKVGGDNEGENNSPKPRKHKWSWETELKELSDSDEEGGPAPTHPISHAEDSPSPPASRDQSAKSKGKRPLASPKKPQRLPLTTVRSDSRVSVRGSAEPDASDSEADASLPPSPPGPKHRASRRTADTAMVDDPESEAPRASSSKSRSNGLNSADVDVNDPAPPDSTKRKRKAVRKPTAKVNCHGIHSMNSH